MQVRAVANGCNTSRLGDSLDQRGGSSGRRSKMALLPQNLTHSFDRGERMRLVLFSGAIVLLHLVGWSLLLSVAPQYPALVGLGGLATASACAMRSTLTTSRPLTTPLA